MASTSSSSGPVRPASPSQSETLTTTAPLTQKRTPRRTGKRSKDVLEPGKPQKADSYIDVHESEAEVAAYCGFDDIAKFRNFILSPYVLKFFCYFHRIKGQAKRVKALDLLQDVRDYDRHWASDNDPSKVYPMNGLVGKELKSQAHWQLALIAWQMLRASRKALFVGRDPKETNEAFTNLTGCKVPKVAELPASKLPNLGPYKGETQIEPHNRCLNLLGYLAYAASKSQWERRFGSANWSQSISITLDYVPNWMRCDDSLMTDEIELPDEFGSVSEDKPEPREVQVVWKFDSNNKAAKDYRKYAEEEDIVDELVTKMHVTIEASMSGPEVRDLIRAAFKLNQYSGQLSQLTLTITQDAEVTSRYSLLTDDFADIKQRIWEYETKSPKVLLTMIVKVRDEEQSCWEYQGPPSLLQSLLEAKDGDIRAKQDVPADRKDEVQGKIYAMATDSMETPFDPLKLFKGDKDRMKIFYGGHDVTTTAGRLTWQLEVLQKIAGRQETYREDTKIKNFRKKRMTEAQGKSINEAYDRGLLETLDVEADEDDLSTDPQTRYYAYQIATAGTQAQVGPPIDIAATALELKPYIASDGREYYELVRFSKDSVKRAFRPWQANGCAWALGRQHGRIPQHPEASPEAKKAAKSLAALQTGGTLIADQTGLGKTTFLLGTLLHCEYDINKDADGKATYKMTFLEVPQNLIRQWAHEILDFWPYFNLVISYDDGSMSERLSQHVVTGSAVKAWPKKDLWPKKYHYIFDQRDPRTGRTIFLTTPETNVERSMYIEKIYVPAVPFDPPIFDPVTNEEILREPPRVVRNRKSRLRNVFRRVGCDEASKLKTVGTYRWLATKLLNADHYDFMTATPMLNTGYCFLGPLCLVWATTEKLIKLQSEEVREWVNDRVGTLGIFDDVDELDDEDPRRLGLLNPYSVKALLDTEDRPRIAKCFPKIEKLMVIRRNLASKIPYDAERTRFCILRDMILPHYIKTRPCVRRDDEEAEFQWCHRDAARRFVDAKKRNEKTSPLSMSASKDKMVYGAAEMRELIIITGSTRAAIFNMIANQIDSDTLASTVDKHRRNRWTGIDAVKFICRATSQTPPKTAAGYLEFLAHGSPMIRALSYELWLKLKNKEGGKVLLTEEVPLLAWWWDMFLNLALIKTTVYHAALSSNDRDKLVNRFNDDRSDLQAMIMPYDVGGLGLNLQEDCHNVIVMSAAKNHGSEMQTMARPIRMNQKKEVVVVKVFVENSVCGYRESRKADKFIVELATRAQDPELRKLAVELLNEYQQEVREAQDARENQPLIQSLKARNKRKRELAALAADETVVSEKVDIDSSRILRSQRQQAPKGEQYQDIQWTDGGKKQGVVSQAELQARLKATIGSDSENEYLKPKTKERKKKKRRKTRRSESKDDDAFEDSESDVRSDSSCSEYDDAALSSEEEEEEEGAGGNPNASDPKKEAKREALRMMRSEEQMDEVERQLVQKLTLPYDKVYNDEDLNDNATLRRALKLIHCRKMGIPFDDVPSVHIKYTQFPAELIKSIEEKATIHESKQAFLKHLLEGGTEKSFKGEIPTDPPKPDSVKDVDPAVPAAKPPKVPGPASGSSNVQTTVPSPDQEHSAQQPKPALVLKLKLPPRPTSTSVQEKKVCTSSEFEDFEDESDGTSYNDYTDKKWSLAKLRKELQNRGEPTTGLGKGKEGPAKRLATLDREDRQRTKTAERKAKKARMASFDGFSLLPPDIKQMSADTARDALIKLGVTPEGRDRKVLLEQLATERVLRQTAPEITATDLFRTKRPKYDNWNNASIEEELKKRELSTDGDRAATIIRLRFHDVLTFIHHSSYKEWPTHYVLDLAQELDLLSDEEWESHDAAIVVLEYRERYHPPPHKDCFDFETRAPLDYLRGLCEKIGMEYISPEREDCLRDIRAWGEEHGGDPLLAERKFGITCRGVLPFFAVHEQARADMSKENGGSPTKKRKELQ